MTLTCIVCNRDLDQRDGPQTCIRCLGRVRSSLTGIVDAYALLPAELIEAGGTSFEPIPTGPAESRILGGDALVLLAPGSEGAHWARGDWHDKPPVNDNLPSDPQPPLAVLAGWEDDWRSILGLPAAGPATMATVTRFLHDHLGWAAQHHPAFDEFATDVYRLRVRLEQVTKTSHAPVRGIGCPECGETLIRRYADPDPCPNGCPHDGPGHDQGGLRDGWQCPNRTCDRHDRGFTDAEYNFALWIAWENQAMEATR